MDSKNQQLQTISARVRRQPYLAIHPAPMPGPKRKIKGGNRMKYQGKTKKERAALKHFIDNNPFDIDEFTEAWEDAWDAKEKIFDTQNLLGDAYSQAQLWNKGEYMRFWLYGQEHFYTDSEIKIIKKYQSDIDKYYQKLLRAQ